MAAGGTVRTKGRQVLLVDDDPAVLRALYTFFDHQGYPTESATSAGQAVLRIQSGLRPELILLDLEMPGMNGLEAAAQLRRLLPPAKIAILSEAIDPQTVVRAMQAGANDFLGKPAKEAELAALVERLLGASAPAPPPPPPPPPKDDRIIELPNDVTFVCGCPAMLRLRDQARVIAPSDIPVLLLGESGTGKEVLATWIHYCSNRADKSFLKVNCAAVPGDLLESELFGYEAGAFTGALKSRPGKFEQCDGGTILLDEIAEMPFALQAKLLHVLQDSEFTRLGARQITRVNVRVLSATNLNVQEAIAQRKLRPDLYYRLNGLSFRLPPLRERRDEIPLLITHFIKRMAGELSHAPPPLTPRLLDACMTYKWPGNVRELWHFVNRYLVLGDEDLALAELAGQAEAAGSSGGLKSIVRAVKNDAEAIAITDALRQTQWRRKEAAALLRISYKALLYKMRQLNLSPPKT